MSFSSCNAPGSSVTHLLILLLLLLLPARKAGAAAAAPAAAVRRGNAAAAAAAAHHSASVPSSSVAQLPVRPSCNALMGTACKRRSNLPAAETAASQLDCLLHLNNAVRCVRELGVLQVMLLCY
jgi:hypothetical protein